MERTIGTLAKFKNEVDKTEARRLKDFPLDTDESKNIFYEEHLFSEEEKMSPKYNYYKYNSPQFRTSSSARMPYDIYSDLVSKGFSTKKKEGDLYNYVQFTYEPETYTNCDCVEAIDAEDKINFEEEKYLYREKETTTIQYDPFRQRKQPIRASSMQRLSTPSETKTPIVRVPSRGSLGSDRSLDFAPEKSPKDRFRCISLAMLKSRGPHCEDRKITRRARG